MTKIGVIGAGAVGSATTLSLLARGVARDIVLVDRDAPRARPVALDMHYGAPLYPPVRVRAGGYDELDHADLLIVTAGVNEKAGGAVDRADPEGRLKLLRTNADVYRQLVPELVAAAPDATLMVVTDPPDPLADLARALAGHERIFSSGTVVDSLRFRVHLGERLGVCTSDVQAVVVGEHGTSEVLVWSSASIAGVPVLDILATRGEAVAKFRADVEQEIRYANINIIEGIGASQYGIGAVCARLAEAVLRDERTLFTVAAYQPDYQTTLSLLAVLGRDGVDHTYHPRMTDEEHDALHRSAAILRQAVRTIE